MQVDQYIKRRALLAPFFLVVLIGAFVGCRVYLGSQSAKKSLEEEFSYFLNLDTFNMQVGKIGVLGFWSNRLENVEFRDFKKAFLKLEHLDIHPSGTFFPPRYRWKVVGKVDGQHGFSVDYSMNLFKPLASYLPYRSDDFFPGHWELRFVGMPLEFLLTFLQVGRYPLWENLQGEFSGTETISSESHGSHGDLNLLLSHVRVSELGKDLVLQTTGLHFAIKNNDYELQEPLHVSSELGGVSIEGKIHLPKLATQTELRVTVTGDSELFSLLKKRFHCPATSVKVVLRGLEHLSCLDAASIKNPGDSI